MNIAEMIRTARQAVVRIETGSSVGSGAIFAQEGNTAFVITNEHVVGRHSTVTVTVNDSRRYEGIVRGTDATRDLAVVAICCGTFHKLDFGYASGLQPGDEVIAIGYAHGIGGEATVTRGIISAIRYDRNHQSDVIQTDAAINPGNSGGPMLNLEGKIVGINTYILRDTEGLNFAISEKTARTRAYELMNSSARPTPAPTRRPTPTPNPSRSGPGFGPIDGDLWHNPDDGLIETEPAGVNLTDFIVSANLFNPYSATTDSWDYGIIVRDEGRRGGSIDIVIHSNQRWTVNRRTDSQDADSTRSIAQGTDRSIRTGAGEHNRIWLMTAGARGLLFINGNFARMLDLSAHIRTGDISVTTGNYRGNEVAGAVTRFEDFQGSPIDHSYGPASGRLEHQSGYISHHSSNQNSVSFVTEAEFTNPSGNDWDYGFIFRHYDDNALEIVSVDGRGWWHHNYKEAGDEQFTENGSGRLASGISRSTNHLMLLATRDTGYLFVNGSLATTLDLSHNLEQGDVKAVSGLFRGNTGEPSFRNFNVWNFD